MHIREERQQLLHDKVDMYLTHKRFIKWTWIRMGTELFCYVFVLVWVHFVTDVSMPVLAAMLTVMVIIFALNSWRATNDRVKSHEQETQHMRQGLNLVAERNLGVSETRAAECHTPTSHKED